MNLLHGGIWANSWDSVWWEWHMVWVLIASDVLCILSTSGDSWFVKNIHPPSSSSSSVPFSDSHHIQLFKTSHVFRTGEKYVFYGSCDSAYQNGSMYSIYPFRCFLQNEFTLLRSASMDQICSAPQDEQKCLLGRRSTVNRKSAIFNLVRNLSENHRAIHLAWSTSHSV